MITRSFAWAFGALAFGAIDLYAVEGSFDEADLLLLGLGALPAIVFGALVLRSKNPMDN